LVPLLALTAACAMAGSNLRQAPGGGEASFDAKSFIVGDQRTLILCGGLHYFRIPQEEWRDRLLQTRLAGFNMVEAPVPWNLHQPARGAALRLDGPADIARFLDLCREMKLLVFLRIGPYVNATVSAGGLPAWLADDPRVLIRAANDRFLDAVRQYWAKLLPLVAVRQVPKGPVALIQIEDHYQGTDERYLPRLFDELRNHAIKVPVVLSGLNPTRDFQRIERTEAAFFATTELMPAPVLQWGERASPFRGFADILFEGLAKGAGGYNHSLWAAGTNLALLPACGFPTRFEAASSGLLECGGHGPAFAEAAQANWFARAFEDVLTQATSSTLPPFFASAAATDLVAKARGNGTTTLLFVKRRYGEGELRYQDPTTGEPTAFRIGSARFRHMVFGFPLAPETGIIFSTAQVLAIQRLPDRLLFVVYTSENSEAIMVFRAPKQPTVRAGDAAFSWNEKAHQLTLRWKCAAKGERKDFAFDVVGGASVPRVSVQVIALEESQLAQTWLLDGAGVLVGAPAVGEWTTGGEPAVELRLPARRVRLSPTFYPVGPQAGLKPATGLSDVKHDPAARRIDFKLDVEIMEPLTVFLRKWETADALAEAAPAFDDAAWREAPRPEPLGEDHHGWYRCHVKAAKAATRKLILENVADAATVFLNGRYVGQSPTKRLADGPRSFANPAHFDLPLQAGDNVLAILAKNWGCYSNASSYGVAPAAASGWGILGAVTVDGQPPGRWRQSDGLAPQGRSLAWSPLDLKSEIRNPKSEMRKLPVRWFRTSFSPRKHPAHLAARLHVKGLSHGAVWLNGHFCGLYSLTGGEVGQGLRLPNPWLRETNELIFLEEGGQQPTEAEVRFDRDETYVPLRLEFTATPTPSEDPTKKPKARPKATPKATPKPGPKGGAASGT